MAGSWHKMAIGLRLSSSIIRLIAKQCSSDPEYCLFTAVEDWLKKMYKIEKYGNPSWQALVRAVASPAGGANQALAQAIAEKHWGE